ncbi:MAG: glycosyltransferase family 2 protein, partial [Flavisolibacter sp.]
MKLSVVIITLNEENNIIDCIRSAQSLSDDIIVVDAESCDRTIQFAEQEGASVYSTEWLGYGFSRNLGASKSKYNWILALDADERVSPELIRSIQISDLDNPFNVFNFRRQNYIN